MATRSGSSAPRHHREKDRSSHRHAKKTLNGADLMAAIAEQVDVALKSLEAQLNERAEAERTPRNEAVKEALQSGDSEEAFLVLPRHEETDVSLIRFGSSVLKSTSKRSKQASLDGQSSFQNSRIPSSVVSPVSTSFSMTATDSRRSIISEYCMDKNSPAKPLKSIMKRDKNRTDHSETGRFDFSFGVPGKNNARIPVHLVVEYDQEGLQRIYANGREAHFS
ncbi:hypothetical protein L596_019514 [Steinernema carpocapsae]|nr:hypothetical protein L596_019514 [Steinernema carpocapsae]